MYALNLLEGKVGEKRREVGKEGEPIQGCIIKLAATGMFRKLYNQNLKVIHTRTEGKPLSTCTHLPLDSDSVRGALILNFGFAHAWIPDVSLVISQRQGMVSWGHMRSGELVLSRKETGKWCRSGV